MSELHRPGFHFTPDSMWMNDPNGMVYYKGEYHLFYQYYPDSTVWGPMHWGHAVSKDMISWEHLPIALFPDSLGYIFSGSAVIDWKNTSGLGKNNEPPFVAIFTHHNMKGEKAGSNDFQYQSIAYSNDKGRSWTKFKGNPVLANHDKLKDFRDPKVIWHKKSQKWIMVLAARDKVKIYSSPDLKKWKFESDFGIKNDNRLWECPDLFPINVEGTDELKWILIVSMQSGAPNGGTGTSYFVGDFDGHHFVNTNQGNAQFWLDYGTDNYAMVSWSDVPDSDGRRLMMGWMSNWLYAQKVPTVRWRSAMTLPREVRLVRCDDGYYRIRSLMIAEFDEYWKNKTNIKGDASARTTNIDTNGLYLMNITFLRSQGLNMILTSQNRDTLTAGYTADTNLWYIDRSKAGKAGFYDHFASRHTAPAMLKGDTARITILLDRASIELFGDDGLTTMTDIFFPTGILNKIDIVNGNGNSSDGIKKEIFPISTN